MNEYTQLSKEQDDLIMAANGDTDKAIALGLTQR